MPGDILCLTGRRYSQRHWALPIRCCCSNSSLSLCFPRSDRCHFLVSEQESNQRNRHRGGAVRRFAPAPEPIRKGMIAPGNHCIERFAALCNTLPYVPLPARTWHLRSTLTSLDYRFSGRSVAGAPLSLPCRFYPYSPCMAKIGTFLPCSGCRLRCSGVSLVRPGIS